MKLRETLRGAGLRRSIKGRLVLYMLLLVVVPFFLIGLVAYQGEEVALRERIRGHLTSIADIQKARIRTWLAERRGDTRMLASDPAMARYALQLGRIKSPQECSASPLCRQALSEAAEFRDINGYLKILLLDKDGRVVVSTDPAEVGQPKGREAYFKGAMSAGPGGVFIQDIYYDKGLGALAMAFSGPIKDVSGRGGKAGAAVLFVGMDRSFYPIFAGWPGMGRTGDVLIGRREGGNLVYLNRLRYLPDAPLKLMFRADENAPQPMNHATAGEEYLLETKDYRGVKVLAACRYIPETKWGLVVKEDHDDAFAPVHRLTRRVVLTLCAMLLLVGVLIYYISKKVADPVVSLNEVAKKISEGDFSVSLPVRRMDEIGSLANTFNEMALALTRYRREVDEKGAELGKANDDLVALAQSLEEKVKERTQELEGLNRALFSMMEDLDERTEALETSQYELKKFAAELEESRNRVRENLDIVERANIELRRMDRMKDHFLGMMSHELRTPLSLITGYSSNILSDADIKLDQRVLEALRGIAKGADRLKNIVAEMLDVSQIDAKGLRLTFVPENIGALVDGTVKELGSFIRERNQRVMVGDYSALPELLIDRKRMSQVLVNILGNAIKFTPDGGRIDVTFTYYTEECEVSPTADGASYLDVMVKDGGIGLDRDEIDRIFEKFYEVGEIDRHATSKYGFLGRGVGLGLPIARGIVEAHGGRLWAESEGYDPKACKGSTFHIALPLKADAMVQAGLGPVFEAMEKPPAAMPAAKPEAAEPPVRPEARPRVLVIDDDPDLLAFTALVLKRDYEVIEARGGEEGLKKAFERPPELILLDIYMDDMNGYQVCEVLKGDERTRDVPVAMFTAGVQRWEVDKGFKSGAVDYITKPFRPDELVAKVGDLISGRYEGAKNKVD